MNNEKWQDFGRTLVLIRNMRWQLMITPWIISVLCYSILCLPHVEFRRLSTNIYIYTCIKFAMMIIRIWSDDVTMDGWCRFVDGITGHLAGKSSKKGIPRLGLRSRNCAVLGSGLALRHPNCWSNLFHHRFSLWVTFSYTVVSPLRSAPGSYLLFGDAQHDQRDVVAFSGA
jgi:hypothetical protein